MALPTFTPGTQIRAQEMNDALATLFDMVYPVGSIYMSASLSTADAVNAALPGTWQAWGAGRVPVSVNTSDADFNAANKTGGAKTVTLTVEQIPAHGHKANDWVIVMNSDYASSGDKIGINTGGGQASAKVNARKNSDNYISNNTGGGEAHENMPPYITCYMYKRIS